MQRDCVRKGHTTAARRFEFTTMGKHLVVKFNILKCYVAIKGYKNYNVQFYLAIIYNNTTLEVV